MQEIWKDVVGYEGLYQVSNLGRVKNVNKNIIKKSTESKGYLRIGLNKHGKTKKIYPHRLVAQAFIPNPNNLPCVNHKDCNPKNNCVDNLEWCTCQENIQHAWENKLNVASYGENHPNHKLTKEQAIYIKENYKPRDKEYGARALARKFNVSTGPIQNILSGKGWKSINENNK